MTETTLSLTDDLSQGIVFLTIALLGLSVATLLFELAKQKRRSAVVFLSGLLGTMAVGLSIFRPVAVTAKTSQFGPRIVVLVDQSRRLLLPEGSGTRDDLAAQALEELTSHYKAARLAVLGFGDEAPRPLREEATRTSGSDLVGALDHIQSAPGERPQAIVVVSDGRLTRPAEGAEASALKQTLGNQQVPIHSVSLLAKSPTDASIREVKTAGAAVAHQPLSMTVEVGCSSALDCASVPVKVEELLHGEKPLVLASGVARVTDGSAKIELQITLDRAGSRVLRVSIKTPKEDSIPENDVRYLTFAVAKERVRLLHLAGRPTNDVRALRRWLKSDESVDVVAFFILRGLTDDPGASESELALIRFPVDELFTEHLPSFDAIILQDIDAIRYKLSDYLVRLEGYVKKGGGLIMVGGPSSFAGGNYAGTPLDSVLPVEQPRRGSPSDSSDFVPNFTEAGRVAPVTRKLRALLGGELPEMAGANMLGGPRPGAIVLLEHPRLSVGSLAMPVLALGEAGDGRAIALGVDSTHKLAFGELASTASGRGYGALWDGLLGWLMRDPRYEAARVEVLGECIEGQTTTLRVHRLPGMSGDIHLSLSQLSEQKTALIERDVADNHSASVDIPLEGLVSGGYSARVTVGAAPATRNDFGCEKGGHAWADSRPDSARLAAISLATGGTGVKLGDVKALPSPEVTEVTAERHAKPLLPAWVWSLASALLLGVHWVARRQTGLS